MTGESELIDQLKLGSACAYDQLYKSYYPSIEKHILANSGSKADAQDIFQETVIILNVNLKKQDFVLTSGLKTYLFSISRNLWLKSLSKTKNISSIEGKESHALELKDFSEEERESQKYISGFIEKIINKAPNHCKRIIDFVFFRNASTEQVAEELGYNNNHTLSNVKYKCIQHLRKASDKEKLDA